MSIIEQRVVSLDFDNAKFSSGVKDTMSMLDRLKSAFSFKGSTAGIDAAQTALTREFQSIKLTLPVARACDIWYIAVATC